MADKRRYIISSMGIMVIIIISILVYNYFNNSRTIIENNKVYKSNKDTLSIMIETNAGSGNYETTTGWPDASLYYFNESLSKCANEGEMMWDSSTNQVIMSGVKSDRCYAYFNKKITFAQYIQGLYTTDGTNNLYYHDGTGSYTNASLEAADNSYRYAGSSESTNNYVCFGSTASTCPDENLYRIIGVFDDDGDGTYNVKLISAEFAFPGMLGDDNVSSDFGGYQEFTSSDSYPYRGSNGGAGLYYWNNANKTAAYNATGYYNVWSYSYLNTKHLNGYYLNTYLGSTWSDKIATTDWKVGGNTYANLYSKGAKTAYTSEVVSPNTSVESTYNAKVALMYISDYYYAASPTYWSYVGYDYSGTSTSYGDAIDSNWLYLAGYWEWTLARYSSDSNELVGIATAGNAGEMYVELEASMARPTFYLNSDVTLSSGTGSSSDPFRLT